jgi:hypothetical protein
MCGTIISTARKGQDMTKYRIGIPQLTWVTVEVEAEDQADAIEKAYDNAPDELCASCTGWGSKTFLREVDDLGSLVDVKIKLDYTVDVLEGDEGDDG